MNSIERYRWGFDTGHQQFFLGVEPSQCPFEQGGRAINVADRDEPKHFVRVPAEMYVGWHAGHASAKLEAARVKRL